MHPFPEHLISEKPIPSVWGKTFKISTAGLAFLTGHAVLFTAVVWVCNQMQWNPLWGVGVLAVVAVCMWGGGLLLLSVSRSIRDVPLNDFKKTECDTFLEVLSPRFTSKKCRRRCAKTMSAAMTALRSSVESSDEILRFVAKRLQHLKSEIQRQSLFNKKEFGKLQHQADLLANILATLVNSQTAEIATVKRLGSLEGLPGVLEEVTASIVGVSQFFGDLEANAPDGRSTPPDWKTQARTQSASMIQVLDECAAKIQRWRDPIALAGRESKTAWERFILGPYA